VSYSNYDEANAILNEIIDDVMIEKVHEPYCKFCGREGPGLHFMMSINDMICEDCAYEILNRGKKKE